MLLLFFTILSLFVIRTAIINSISNYKSYINVKNYSKKKVKVDSITYNNDSGVKGSRIRYFQIYYENTKNLTLNYPFNNLSSLEIDKLRYEDVNKTLNRDSIYLWVNPKAETLYATEKEIKVDPKNIRKRFLISFSLVIVSFLLYIRIFYFLFR